MPSVIDLPNNSPVEAVIARCCTVGKDKLDKPDKPLLSHASGLGDLGLRKNADAELDIRGGRDDADFMPFDP